MCPAEVDTVLIRLNKYLSLCGVSSRRGADALILEGRITVNNETVEKVGTVIDESSDTVRVDGSVVAPVEKQVYIIFNKPTQVMTTLHDPFDRKTIVYYLAGLDTRVYPIGRLDFDTVGVLLLTNDGDLAYRLAHPKHQVKKIYEVKVTGKFTREAAEKIEGGIRLEDGSIGKGKVRIVSHGRGITKLKMILTEGRKREVKQLCKLVGHPVLQLRRLEFAGITARGVKLGKWRYLTDREVAQLKELVGLR